MRAHDAQLGARGRFVLPIETITPGLVILQMSLGCYWDTTFIRQGCALNSSSVFVVKHAVK